VGRTGALLIGDMSTGVRARSDVIGSGSLALQSTMSVDGDNSLRKSLKEYRLPGGPECMYTLSQGDEGRNHDGNILSRLMNGISEEIAYIF